MADMVFDMRVAAVTRWAPLGQSIACTTFSFIWPWTWKLSFLVMLRSCRTSIAHVLTETFWNQVRPSAENMLA